MGMASVAAGVLGAASGALAETEAAGSTVASGAHLAPSVANLRVRQAFRLRLAAATQESLVPVPPHTTNGDEQRYSD
ncbi:MAG: hypothetical protein ACREQC_14415, partial [Candidatus Binataceae bacterium]